MAERRKRSTKEEVLNAKLKKNAEARAKLQEKMDALTAEEADLKQQLKDLNNAAKKAERAAEAKAKREAKKKADKELLKLIKESGLTAEEVKERLSV